MRREELERLIRMHQASIYRYLRYLGAEATLAEDLVQETFLATMRPNDRQPAHADDPAWPAWLRGIARNLFLVECRRRRISPLVSDGPALERAEAAWAAELGSEGDTAERLAALRECLQALPARQREILDHRYAKHTARSEMARLFGMTEDGIKSLLRRIRAALALCIRKRLRATQSL
jgi:RNA polymerase sigma-70 factor (ECF subfamily)